MMLSVGVCVNFSQSLYSVLESTGKLQGAVVSSKPLQESYQIDLKYISGNATSKCKNYQLHIVIYFNALQVVMILEIH